MFKMKGFADNITVISKPNYTQLFKECNLSACSGETLNILLHTLTNQQEAPDIELKHKNRKQLVVSQNHNTQQIKLTNKKLWYDTKTGTATASRHKAISNGFDSQCVSR